MRDLLASLGGGVEGAAPHLAVLVSRLAFVAYGKPCAQGSKVRTKYALRDSNDAQLTPWRNTVSGAARQAATLDALPRLDGDLAVRATFYFDRPRAHYRTGRNAHLLRDGAPAYPRRVGDIDKLLRALLDAITDSGAWLDDAQVTHIRAAKRWTDPLGPMPSPGVVVEVYPAALP